MSPTQKAAKSCTSIPARVEDVLRTTAQRTLEVPVMAIKRVDMPDPVERYVQEFRQFIAEQAEWLPEREACE